jgi:hypothetical protein
MKKKSLKGLSAQFLILYEDAVNITKQKKIKAMRVLGKHQTKKTNCLSAV